MRKQDPISGTAIAAIDPPATTSVLESQVNALKKQFDELAAIHLSETERLKQKIAINDSCNKAEVMHLRLTYQEDMNEKNLEIKSLKNKLRQLLNKTEIR